MLLSLILMVSAEVRTVLDQFRPPNNTDSPTSSSNWSEFSHPKQSLCIVQLADHWLRSVSLRLLYLVVSQTCLLVIVSALLLLLTFAVGVRCFKDFKKGLRQSKLAGKRISLKY